MSKELTIKERLIKLETTATERHESLKDDIGKCNTNLTNHLRHHWEFNLVLLSAVAIEAIAFLVLVLEHVL